MAPFLLLVLLWGCLAGADPPTVQLDSGPISGQDRDGVRAFLGIPYAAPPVGPLRWRPPQPVAPWSAVRASNAFGARCVQPPPLIGAEEATPQSEDCLYLNVWAPPPAETPRPVMVWIHGGGWTTGSGSQPIYDGRRLAGAGVVLITVNYRLGPFGFLAHPLLSAEGEGAGNYGMLDLVAALRWVQRNAAAFGGDPGRVTIFGESAGGGCVARLLVMPAARGLFHRAIIQSAGFAGFSRHLRDAWPDAEPAEALGARIAQELLPPAAADPLTALRAVPAADLLAAARPVVGLFRAGGNSFAPVVDGALLPDRPEALAARGLAADVPVLLGANADEATIFTARLPLRTQADLRRLAEQGFAGRTDEALRLFPVVDGDVRAAGNALIGVTAFVAEARRCARLLSAPARSRVFLYHFSRVPPLAPLLRQKLGAFHSAEIAYVFGQPDVLSPQRTAPAEDRRLAERMRDAWVRFAATGDPNGGDLPAWPAYDAASDACLEFGDAVRVREGLHRAACDLADAAQAARRGGQ